MNTQVKLIRVELALQEISRRKPNVKNRIEDYIGKAVIDLATEQPALGQLRVKKSLSLASAIVSG